MIERIKAILVIDKMIEITREVSLKAVPTLAALDEAEGGTEFTDTLASVYAVAMVCAVSRVVENEKVVVDYDRARKALEEAINSVAKSEAKFDAKVETATAEAIKKASRV